MLSTIAMGLMRPAHGPTTKLVGVPVTLSLTVGDTGTLAPVTPKDVNGVATGETYYWHSSNTAIATVTATGDYVAVGNGTVTFTANMDPQVVISDAEPLYTGAAGQELIADDDMSSYTTLDNMVANAAVGHNLSPNSTTNGSCAIVTGLDGNAQALKVSGIAGVGDGYFATPGAATSDPRTRYFSQFLSFEGRVTQGTNAAGPSQVKWVEMIHPDSANRAQFNTTFLFDQTPTNVAHGSHFGMHDMAYAPPTGSDGVQTVGPWLDAISNDGLTHRFTHWSRCNTPNAGDMRVEVQSVAARFLNDMGGVLVNGNRVLLYYQDSLGGLVQGSTAEFEVSAFDGHQHATLTRMPDITGSTVSYPGAIDNFSQIPSSVSTLRAYFSVSQLSEPSFVDGALLATNETNTAFAVSAIAGDGLSCTITKRVGDNNCVPFLTDLAPRSFSTILDGIARMYIDGSMVVNISQSGVGHTLPGGEQAQCTTEAIATLSAGLGVYCLLIGGPQTNGPDYSLTFQNLKWWAVNA